MPAIRHKRNKTLQAPPKAKPPFSSFKAAKILDARNPWASLCVILNHTNRPIDMIKVIRRVLQEWPVFKETRGTLNFPGLVWECVQRLETASKRSRQCCLRYGAVANYLLTKGKRDMKTKKEVQGWGLTSRPKKKGGGGKFKQQFSHP